MSNLTDSVGKFFTGFSKGMSEYKNGVPDEQQKNSGPDWLAKIHDSLSHTGAGNATGATTPAVVSDENAKKDVTKDDGVYKIVYSLIKRRKPNA